MDRLLSRMDQSTERARWHGILIGLLRPISCFTFSRDSSVSIESTKPHNLCRYVVVADLLDVTVVEESSVRSVPRAIEILETASVFAFDVELERLRCGLHVSRDLRATIGACERPIVAHTSTSVTSVQEVTAQNSNEPKDSDK